ncbi:Uncharacterised protein [uncultured Clostridium sp.]|nr:Uncharacterised protein [uncultured Clostridium sp.]SCJ36095.1 Uncharacterised protein [uncultured Clostridium sp.]
MSKFDTLINNLIKNAPEFMLIKENEDTYVVLDYIVSSLDNKAMTWLFKVYLDKNFNIIVEDNLTNYIKDKYKDRNLKLINLNGNLFLNKDVISVILEELELSNQGEYDEENLTFSLK